MLGRPEICDPVCRKVMAGSWLIASVCSERITAMSSAIPAVNGSSSLYQVPPAPCWANLKIEPAIGSDAWLPVIPVSRCPCRTESGSCWPFCSTNSGL